jgi:hypothetical protein
VARLSKAENVYTNLPQGYLLTAEQGVDFTVHHVRKMKMLGEPGADFRAHSPETRFGKNTAEIPLRTSFLQLMMRPPWTN